MKRLFGGLLLAAGILLMFTSGLCTLLVIGVGSTTIFEDPTMIFMIFMPLLIGGIPFAVGFGLFQWGRSLRQETDHDVF